MLETFTYIKVKNSPGNQFKVENIDLNENINFCHSCKQTIAQIQNMKSFGGQAVHDRPNPIKVPAQKHIQQNIV